MKKTLFLYLVPLSLFATNENNETTLIEDIQRQIQNFKNETNSTKSQDRLSSLQAYIESIKLEDDFDKSTISDDFKILAYKENYILPVSFDNRNHSDNRKSVESVYQVSLKLPLYKNIFGSHGDLYSAYTQNSYWQVYDRQHSAPFRETNYQPEIFLNFATDKKITKNIVLLNTKIALIHQSNGKTAPDSRSWNRTDLEMVFKHSSDIKFGFNIHNRWDEDAKSSPTESKGDDNPDLNDYIGRQKYFVGFKTGKYSLKFSHQNDIGHYDINKGSFKTEVSFPSFNKNFKWYINHFYGYGESLIDYNDKVNKIGFGVLVAEAGF